MGCKSKVNLLYFTSTKFPENETYKTLGQTLIISLLDCGNALSYNIQIAYIECMTVLHI